MKGALSGLTLHELACFIQSGQDSFHLVISLWPFVLFALYCPQCHFITFISSSEPLSQARMETYTGFSTQATPTNQMTPNQIHLQSQTSPLLFLLETWLSLYRKHPYLFFHPITFLQHIFPSNPRDLPKCAAQNPFQRKNIKGFVALISRQ